MKAKPFKRNPLVQEVINATRSAQDGDALFSALTEEVCLSAGQKVYVAGSMGMASVPGTFQGITAGGYAKVKCRDGVHTVLPQKVWPIR